MTLHPVWSFLIISLIELLIVQAALADTQSIETTIPESYPKDYIFTLYSHNEPVGPSQIELQSHQDSLGIAYQHRLSHPWVVSVGYRPQSFINRKQDRPTSLITAFNATQRLIRLYHPLYALLGTEILYLIPVRKLNPPVIKDADFSTEIGFGVVGSLWYLIGHNNIFMLDVQRWRGTKTDRLHGVSLSLGLGWGF